MFFVSCHKLRMKRLGVKTGLISDESSKIEIFVAYGDQFKSSENHSGREGNSAAVQWLQCTELIFELVLTFTATPGGIFWPFSPTVQGNGPTGICLCAEIPQGHRHLLVVCTYLMLLNVLAGPWDESRTCFARYWVMMQGCACASVALKGVLQTG